MSPLLQLSLPVCLTAPSFSPLLCRVPAHVTVVCRSCMHLRWTSDSLHIAYVVCVQVVVFFFSCLMGNSLFPSRRFIIIDAVLVKLPRSFSHLKLTPISVGPIYPRSWRNLPQRVTNVRKRFYIYSFFAFWLVSPAPCAFILQLKTSCKISMEDMGSNESLFLKQMFFWRKIKW